MILPCQRDKFDIPASITYLDCAYMSPLPKATLQAGEKGLHAKARPWQIGHEEFFEAGDRLRTLMAKLAGGDASDYALVPSVSYGMAVATRNLPVKPGAEILVLDRQFPSNVYPWSKLAQDSKANLRTVCCAPGQTWTEAVLAAMGSQTAILALPHVHWIDGGLLDLVRIGKQARRAGAALVLDLTQSLGVLPFSMAEVDPDFVVVANYKWLLGPYSTGFLYAAKRHQRGEPLEAAWQSRIGSDNFAALTSYTNELTKGATRYDMGERSNFAALPAIGASLQQILAWGVSNIEQTLHGTTSSLVKIAQDHGLQPASNGPAPAHYLSLQLPQNAPPDILQRARKRGVYFSHRGDRLRITPHLWVNEADLTRFAQVLDELF